MALVAGLTGLTVGKFGEYCEGCDFANLAYPVWLICAVVGLAALVAILKTGRFKIMCAALPILALTYGDVVPATSECKQDGLAKKLIIISFNAWGDNKSPYLSAQWLRNQKADVVVLLEAKGKASTIPQLLGPEFPYRSSCAVRLPCSTMILSRTAPVATFAFARGDVENRRSLSATAMQFGRNGNGRVTIVAVHLSRPLPLGRQRIELETLRLNLLGFDPAKLIIAGDFNTTRHNADLVRFAHAMNLREARSGATWPTPAYYPGLPSILAIDHILTGASITLHSLQVGPVLGSDHRPVAAILCH